METLLLKLVGDNFGKNVYSIIQQLFTEVSKRQGMQDTEIDHVLQQGYTITSKMFRDPTKE